jgi:hypothetical protein
VENIVRQAADPVAAIRTRRLLALGTRHFVEQVLRVESQMLQKGKKRDSENLRNLEWG